MDQHQAFEMDNIYKTKLTSSFRIWFAEDKEFYRAHSIAEDAELDFVSHDKKAGKSLEFVLISSKYITIDEAISDSCIIAHKVRNILSYSAVQREWIVIKILSDEWISMNISLSSVDKLFNSKLQISVENRT